MGAYDELQVALTGLEAQAPAVLGTVAGVNLVDALQRAAAASGASDTLNQQAQDAAEFWFLENAWHVWP